MVNLGLQLRVPAPWRPCISEGSTRELSAYFSLSACHFPHVRTTAWLSGNPPRTVTQGIAGKGPLCHETTWRGRTRYRSPAPKWFQQPGDFFHRPPPPPSPFCRRVAFSEEEGLGINHHFFPPVCSHSVQADIRETFAATIPTNPVFP